MLNSITTRYQAAIKSKVAFNYLYNNRRSFINSAFVSNEKRNDDNNKEDGDKKEEGQQQQETPKEEEAEELPAPSFEEELKALSIKFQELQSNYLLSLADTENLRQRHMKEIANAKDFAIQKFAKDLLDSVDILDLALNSVPEPFRERGMCVKEDPKEIVEQLVNLYTGVSMTESELQKTLKRYGVEMDNPIDQVFDPNKHEAVFQTAVADKEPGTIFVVQKKGYMLKNRVLRPAQVGVVAAPVAEN